jgi:RNA-directed DNA polymerase
LRRDLTASEAAYLGRIERGFRSSVPAESRAAAVVYARKLIERGFPVLFDQRHLAYVTGVHPQILGLMAQRPDRFYTSFLIRKRRGGSRVIDAPTPELKKVQHWMQRNVTSQFLHHPACHGFTPGRSILTNAEPHVGARIVLKLDIRDFFGTVRRHDAFRAFRFAGFSQAVANLLAGLTTLQGVLPQGAPTSPDLANYAAYRLDVRLSRFAEARQLAYTRYADDLTFSGEFVPAERRTIEAIMRSEGFAPNSKKLRYLLPSERQAVTGIVVNEKLNWPRARRRWLRQEVHYLERFGVDSHLEHRGVDRARYKEFIYGHAYALSAVRTDEAEALLAKLDALTWPY